ncbi:ECF transporter S component [Alkalihalobacillus sp. AL-G]|uniref:ECF transporter S component n=1 Tax=Alkalihalobacillus sp. AL-G TaxID=2926399 RepID=UPI00272D2F85|nr:ECF transporter S component [Alkalihalobacillus sp. AL-G]WLD91668.1 ECF transporter S component [Alkalihalobacillus sp. AL-G]
MNSKKLSWLAMFMAMSAAGASLKIPAIVGSVALDSFPALVAAILLGLGPGIIVAGFGHLLSALIGGMPLGPFHLIIAIEMALLVWLFGMLYQKGKWLSASVSFILGNAFAAPLPFFFLMGQPFYTAIVSSLLIGSILNTGLAILAIPRLQSIFFGNLRKKEVRR